jgi:hypothetical protein
MEAELRRDRGRGSSEALDNAASGEWVEIKPTRNAQTGTGPIRGYSRPVELTTNGCGRVAKAKFSPDGSLIVGYSAGFSGNNAVIVWRTDGSGPQTELPIRETQWDVEFSPDGPGRAGADDDEVSQLASKR